MVIGPVASVRIHLINEQLLVGGEQVRHDLAVILIGHLHHLHVLLGVHEVDPARQEVDTGLGVEGDGGVSAAALFGRDHDDAVGTAGTVDGSRSRILEDVDLLHVGGVDDGGIDIDDTVHDIDRSLAGVEGTDTADRDLGVTARTSGSGDDVDAGHLAGHALGDGDGGAALVELFVLDGSDRGGKLLTDQGTVTDDDHVVQGLVISPEQDGISVASVHGDLLGLESDGGADQGGSCGGVEPETAIRIRDGAVLGAFDLDAGADDGLTVFVSDAPADGAGARFLLGRRSGTGRQDDVASFDSRGNADRLEGPVKNDGCRLILGLDCDSLVEIDLVLVVDKQVICLLLNGSDQLSDRDPAVVERDVFPSDRLGGQGKRHRDEEHGGNQFFEN